MPGSRTLAPHSLPDDHAFFVVLKFDDPNDDGMMFQVVLSGPTVEALQDAIASARERFTMIDEGTVTPIYNAASFGRVMRQLR